MVSSLATRIGRLSSETRRVMLGLAGLVAAGVGLAVLWGIGWGLLLVGLGVAVGALLYHDTQGASR